VQIYVLHFHALQVGPPLSGLAFSAPPPINGQIRESVR